MTADVAAPQRAPRFYLSMAILLAGVVFVGFAPSFYLKGIIHAPPPLSDLTRVHGVVFTAWILLFIAQTSLVAANRRDIHRKLGIFGAVLGAAILALGAYTAIIAGKLGHAPPGAPPPLAFMAVPLIGILCFAGFVGAAILNRGRPEAHKRLMVLATLQLTPPAFGRTALMMGFLGINLFIAFGGADLLLLVAMAHDYLKMGRVHSAYLYGGAVMIASQVVTFLSAGSEAWSSFAAWLTALV